MTDKEKLINLLAEFGVEFIVSGDNIFCNEGDEKVEGYSHFYTRFKFTEEGEFITMGARE